MTASSGALADASRSEPSIDAALSEVPPFEPSRTLGNPHLMTWTVALPRRAPGLAATATVEELRVDDHARVRLVWNLARDPGAPVLVLCHGLTGCARTSYMVGVAGKAAARGLSVVRVDARGVGGTEAWSWRMFHAGLTADLELAVRHVAARCPAASIHLAGFSLGGNLVLKLCGEWGAAAPAAVRSAVVVSPALDLARCAARIDAPGMQLYRSRFLAELAAMVRRNAAAFALPLDERRLRRIRTMRDFDAFHTARVWGFTDVDDYYARASALPGVDRVAVPTLAIAARDDFLVPFATLAPLAGRAAIRLVATERGGHLAFLGRRRAIAPGGARDPDRRWAENRVVQWAQASSGFRPRLDATALPADDPRP